MGSTLVQALVNGAPVLLTVNQGEQNVYAADLTNSVAAAVTPPAGQAIRMVRLDAQTSLQASNFPGIEAKLGADSYRNGVALSGVVIKTGKAGAPLSITLKDVTLPLAGSNPVYVEAFYDFVDPINGYSFKIDPKTLGTLTVLEGYGVPGAFSRSTVATYRDNDGVRKSAAINTARIVYDSTTRRQGFRSEGSRTNYARQSRTLDDAYWLKVGATVTANAATGAYNAATMDKLVEDGSTGAHRVRVATISLSPQQLVAFSFDVKAAERSQISAFVGEAGGGGNNCNVRFNASTGLVENISDGGTGVTADAWITANINGTYRCHMVCKPSAATGTQIEIRASLYNGSLSYAGDGTSGIYLEAFQLEVLSSSSVIDTTSADVTRGTDVQSFNIGSSNAFSGNKGTIFVKAKSDIRLPSALPSGTKFCLFSMDDGATGNVLMYLRRNVTGVDIEALFSDSRPAVTPYDQAIAFDWSNQVEVRAAISWGGENDDGKVRVSINGGAASWEATNPLIDSFLLGNNQIFAGNSLLGSEALFGVIEELSFFPKLMTMAELNTLTT